MVSPQSQLTLKKLTAHRAPTADAVRTGCTCLGPKSSTSRVEVSISVPRKVLEEEPMEVISSMKQFPPERANSQQACSEHDQAGRFWS
jgi:hypothetical protein